LEDPPPPSAAAKALRAMVSKQGLGIYGPRAIATQLESLSRADPKDILAHKREMALLRSVGFRVENVGGVLVQDVRIVVEIPKLKGLRVVDELPEKPRGPYALSLPRVRAKVTRYTVVTEVDLAWEVEAAVGKIQPNATAWSLPFWIGSDEVREFALVARVFGDNIAKAIEVPMTIGIDVAHGFLDDEGHGDDADEEADDNET